MSFSLPADRPAIMGVLNVTPDSFSDGGQYMELDDAIRRGVEMREHGADIIDVGGESTRPGAEPVALEEELRRVVPLVEALAGQGIPISIDTSKASVARAALDAGATVVNDVTALWDHSMRDLCASRGVSVCLMHMQGEPRTMQDYPVYDDVVREVEDYLLKAAARAEDAGVLRERIWIDPGIGFGKTLDHNLLLLRYLDRFVATGYPVTLGVSRKSFLGKLLGQPDTPLPVKERLPGTLAAQVLAQAAGAAVLRVHDVIEARRACDVAAAILGRS